MPSPRRVTAAARTRDRAVGRLTKECAVIIANVRAFFERERRAGRASGLHRVVQRTVDATGVSERTVRRVAEEGHANRLPGGGEAPTRTSPRRIPPEELARARAAVYAQYENRSIPTLDSTLAYLQTEAVVLSWSPSPSMYAWTRTTLFRALQDIGFSFTRGPNHYDVAREKPSIVAQRDSFLASIKQYRDSGRTVYYTDEAWANKNISVYPSWTDGTLRTRVPVPSGKGGRLIVAHVGSRETGLVRDAALVFVGKKGKGDYHKEMCSEVWLKWLKESVFPKISGGVLVVDRAPYHLVRTPETTPAGYKLRKAELAQWLITHQVVPADWEAGWQQARTRAEMKAVADKNKPTPRFLVQELAATFGVSVLISPVAHSDLNPIEMVWGTVKMALKRGNTSFTLSSLKDLVAKEFDKITPEVWAKYEDHAIKMEDFYRGLAAARDAVEGELEGREQEMECVEEDEVNADDEGSESEEDERTDGGSEGMDDEEEG